MASSLRFDGKSLPSWLSLGIIGVLIFTLAPSLFFVSTPARAAGTLYVKTAGTSSNTCADWANACDLQTAITAASSGDQIWVAAGTYYPTSGTDRTISFSLKDGVSIYGGFVGNETSLTQRNWQTNVTTLSGDIGTQADNSDNSYHVVTGASGATSAAVLDGFTITAGNANGGLSNNNGGGMVNTSSSPTLTNLTFISNMANDFGGGMYNEGSSPTLTNVTFSGNTAQYEGGGGMYNKDSSSPTLTNVTFTGNTADYNGGGMSNYSSSPTLTNATFTGNSAGGGGGGMYNEGSSPTLTNVTFSGNSVVNGYYGGGGGMSNSNSSPTLTNVTFSGNSAGGGGGFGGGMYNNYGSDPTIQNSIFWGNSAITSGDQISGSTSIISYSLIQGSGGSGGWDTIIGVDGGNNIDILPQFVDPNAGNYRLELGSPAINAGNDAVIPAEITTDLDGNQRRILTVDMGAYETADGTDTIAPIVNIEQLITKDSLPSLQGTVNDGRATIKVEINSKSYTATNNGDGTWVLADNTIDPALGNGTYEVQVTATDPSNNIGTDTTTNELTVNTNAGRPWYVKATGTSANTCLDWDNGCDLQTALHYAISGDSIWVAKGIYYPDVGKGQTDNDPSSTFTLKDEVSIYGGFAGTETALSERDWETNSTVLSGDLNQNDLTDSNRVVTDTDSLQGTNAYHVVSSSGVTSNTLLDGFTITAGNANGDYPNNNGGGMVNNFSNPTLTNVTFTGNTAYMGGGMFNYSSDPTLTNVTFMGNTTDDDGGGMVNISSSPTLTNVIFKDNQADSDGGGMYNSNSSPTLTNVTFTGNSANNGGGGMSNSYSSNPILTNVTFSGNRAANYYDGGGGMSNSNSSPMLTNVTFSDNTAYNDGGGMYNYDNSSPTLTNVTFSDNTAYSGGGMHNSDGSNPTIQNSILWGNSATTSGDQISGSTSIISYSLIQGNGGSGSSWDTNIGQDGGNNLDMPPQFVDPDTGDYRLQPGSPAIDAGNNETISADVTTDIDGNVRTIDGDSDGTVTVDMGAYEMAADPDTIAPIVSVDHFVTKDPSPPLQGIVNDGRATIKVEVNNKSYTATNNGDGTWVLADDTITPDLGNGTYAVQVTATDLSNNVGTDTTTNELTIINTNAGNPWYVKATGTSANTCLDWDNGCDLQTALHYATSGDSIWVATGIHYPDVGKGQTDNEESSTFTLKDGVRIYGGFDGTETDLSQRDWEANPTVLSGDLDQNDLTDSNRVVTDTDSLQGTNAYHVVSSSGVTSNTLLDGLTITAGEASRPEPHNCGGGMYNYDNSSPTLTNVTFIGNTSVSGGGMLNDNSRPTLTNVTFNGNRAYNSGGGMYNSNSNPTLTNVTFTGNTADNNGGGMYNSNSNPTLTNVTFSGNSADYNGFGGGMYNYANSSPTLTNVTFSGNRSDYNGGGMTNYDNSSPMLTNVTFTGNTADDGGGMSNEFSSPTLTNVTFSGNSARGDGGGGDGGGMYNHGSSPILTNVTFSSNTADNDGGGISNEGSSSLTMTNVLIIGNKALNDGGGGGIFNEESNLHLTNVTISGNSANNGGGICMMGSTIVVQNSILWGNSATGDSSHEVSILDDSSPITFTASLVAGSGGSAAWESGFGNDEGNNLDTDPKFVTPINATLAPITTGDYHVQLVSPVIDAGDNTFVQTGSKDRDGLPRIFNGTVDMGAYEVPITPTLVISMTSDMASAAVGEKITYSYHVTNTGNVTLDTLTATDSRLGTVTLDKKSIAPNGSTRGTLEYTVVEGDLPGPLSHTAIVTGTPPIGNKVAATDTASVVLTSAPTMTISITPDVASAAVGNTITYSYHVTNTGNVTLDTLTAMDSRLGTVTLDKKSLAPDAVTTGTLTYTVMSDDLPGPLTNIMTAKGTPPIGDKVTATDTASVVLTSAPTMTVSITPDVASAAVGNTITYSYHVTNTGNVTLDMLTAMDSRLGTVTLDKKSLAPDAVTTGTLTYTVTSDDLPGPLDNTITVTGTTASGTTTQASASSQVTLTKSNDPIDPGDDPDTKQTLVTPEEGGTITTTTGMEITIPAGSVDTPVTITLRIQDAPSQTVPTGAVGLRSFTLNAVRQADGTPVTTFAKPLTIKIPYTDEDVAKITAQGLTENDMKIAFWNGTAWETLPSTVDTTNKIIIATVDHFTEFLLLAQKAEVTSDKRLIFLPYVLR